jgi:hypothetical protein
MARAFRRSRWEVPTLLATRTQEELDRARRPRVGGEGHPDQVAVESRGDSMLELKPANRRRPLNARLGSFADMFSA